MHLRSFLAAAVLSSVCAPALAQDILSIPADVTERSESLSREIDALYDRQTTEELYIVDVDPESFKTDNIFLKFGDRSFALSSFEAPPATSETTFTWSGALAATDDPSPSTFATEGLFVVDGDEILGTLRTNQGIFRLEPLVEGKHAIIKVREEAFMPDHPESGAALDIETDPTGDEDDVEPRPGEPIDILVLFTPEAALIARNTDLFAQLAVKTTNESLRRSGISGATFRLAGAATLELEEGLGFGIELRRLVNASYPAALEAHQLRNEQKADLVIMITSQQMGGCGKAAAIHARPSTAFSILAIDCAIDNLTFPHEIGHLLGACHDPDQGHGCEPFRFGHGFQRPEIRQRSIMAYDCENVRCARKMQWSRPEQWGNDEESHAARVVEEQASRAAGFRN